MTAKRHSFSEKRAFFFHPFKVNESLLDPRAITCEKVDCEAPWSGFASIHLAL